MRVEKETKIPGDKEDVRAIVSLRGDQELSGREENPELEGSNRDDLQSVERGNGASPT